MAAGNLPDSPSPSKTPNFGSANHFPIYILAAIASLLFSFIYVFHGRL
jgi:hypothetical protein